MFDLFNDSLNDFFDFNNDGELDTYEYTTALETLQSNPNDENKDYSSSSYDYEPDVAECLSDKGIDYDDLEFMDSYERSQVLEDAGLDPDDFDF